MAFGTWTVREGNRLFLEISYGPLVSGKMGCVCVLGISGIIRFWFQISCFLLWVWLWSVPGGVSLHARGI